MSMHVFAEVSSKEAALAVGVSIVEKLTTFGAVTVCDPKQYWKIPEYYEFFVEVQNEMLVDNDKAELANSVGLGWADAGSSLIWNFSEDAQFADDKVRWANLEFVEIA